MGPSASPCPHSHPMLNRSFYLAFVLLNILIIFYSPCATAEPTEEKTEILTPAAIKSVCGRRQWEEPSGRIVGGTETKFADYPWLAALFRMNKTENVFVYFCGGSLLNNYWIITAAHCVYNYNIAEMFWSLGEHDMSHENEGLAYVDRLVDKVIVHPRYNSGTIQHDVALTKIKPAIAFQKHIIPICLPEENNTYVGETAIAAGWGALVHHGDIQNLMREVELPILSNDDCFWMFIKSGTRQNITDNIICAGNELGTVDACQGDSGGPLMIYDKQDKRFILIGLTSWGLGCGEANKPGIYERISQYTYWINQIISKE